MLQRCHVMNGAVNSIKSSETVCLCDIIMFNVCRTLDQFIHLFPSFCFVFSGHKIRRSESNHIFESHQSRIELRGWIDAGK